MSSTARFEPMSHPALFKWKHFQPEIILLNVRWYCRYALSYRDLEEMMAERGLSVDHRTINRWVLQYGPDLDQRCRPHLRMTDILQYLKTVSYRDRNPSQLDVNSQFCQCGPHGSQLL